MWSTADGDRIGKENYSLYNTSSSGSPEWQLSTPYKYKRARPAILYLRDNFSQSASSNNICAQMSASEPQPISCVEESELLSDFDMPPFSANTQTEIRSQSGHRCVLCLKSLPKRGQCAHVIDSSESVGGKIVSNSS